MLQGHPSHEVHLCGYNSLRSGDPCVVDELHYSLNEGRQGVTKTGAVAEGVSRSVGFAYNNNLRKAQRQKHSASKSAAKKWAQMRGNDLDRFRNEANCGVDAFPIDQPFRPLIFERCQLEKWIVASLREWDAGLYFDMDREELADVNELVVQYLHGTNGCEWCTLCKRGYCIMCVYDPIRLQVDYVV